MKIGWATCWILVQVILLCGCGEKNEEKTDGSASVEAAPTSSVPSEVEKAIAEIEKDFALSLPYAATNWSGCAAVAHGTAEKIQKLPPALREPYGRKMAQAILSVPIDHLPYYDRSRTLYMMWIMVEEIGRYKVGWKFVWELRVMRLKRLREAKRSVETFERYLGAAPKTVAIDDVSRYVTYPAAGAERAEAMGGPAADRDELAAWYSALYEGWKSRFDATVALGRIKKLMEFPVGDEIRRKRLLRRANDIESCIGAVISEMADQQAFRPFPAANEAEK